MENPPEGLKQRVLEGFENRPRAPRWREWWAIAATAVLLAVTWFAISERRRAGALESTLALMTAVDTTTATSGATRVFANPQKGVVLTTTALPPAPAGKAYQMWLIKDGGKPEPAGLFQPVAGAAAMHFLPGAIDLATLKMIAVTLEDSGGVPQPTSAPLVAVSIAR